MSEAVEGATSQIFDVEEIIEDIEILPQTDEYGLLNSLLSDFGNEGRIDKLIGKDILYDVSNGVWYIWSDVDGIWKIDQVGKMTELVKAIFRGIKKESKEYANQSEKTKNEEKKKQYKEISEALMSWANKCQNPTKVDACIKLARSSHAILPEEFNQNPHLINFNNGTFNLDRLELQPHTREDKITMSCGWDYDKNADCPEFKKFIERLFQSHENKTDLIRWMQMSLGYCLTGDTDQRIITLLTGTGQNGKSVLMATMARTMGDYSATLNGESLTTISRGKIREDLAQLNGKRFVSVSESPRGAKLDEDIVKHITGGSNEPLKVRSLYKGSFNLYPTCKIFWAFNHLPSVVDMTPSIWNRLKVVPFEEVISEEEKIDMSEIIKAHDKERSGILNWLIAGYKDLQETKNFKWCKAVNTRTEDYHEDEDMMGSFFEEVLEYWKDDLKNNDGTPKMREKFRVKANELYDCYLWWSRERGYTRPWNPTTFGKEMTSRFGTQNKKRYEDGKYYMDIKIKSTVQYIKK